jgi:hypothetical protein
MTEARRLEDSSDGKRREEQNRLRSQMLRKWAKSFNATQNRGAPQARKSTSVPAHFN